MSSSCNALHRETNTSEIIMQIQFILQSIVLGSRNDEAPELRDAYAVQWFEKAGFEDIQIKRIGPKWYRGVRRHGLIMGCSVTGRKSKVNKYRSSTEVSLYCLIDASSLIMLHHICDGKTYVAMCQALARWEDLFSCYLLIVKFLEYCPVHLINAFQVSFNQHRPKETSNSLVEICQISIGRIRLLISEPSSSTFMPSCLL